MPVIRIPRRALFTVLALALLGLLAAFLVPRLPDLPGPLRDLRDERAGRRAAEAAIDAVYRIDTRAGREFWLAGVCAVSTPPGCRIFRTASAAQWETYRYAGVRTSAAVERSVLLARRPGEQVWRVTAVLADPLPGSTKRRDSAVLLVVQTGGEWRFERFLFPAEIAALQQAASREAR